MTFGYDGLGILAKSVLPDLQLPVLDLLPL
jgi:hypothetical protein